MSTAHTVESSVRKPLRLWPGVALAVLIVLFTVGVPIVAPEFAMIGVMVGLGAAVAVIVWWAFFSRAPWAERLGAIAVMAIALAATSLAVHPSIANGMMGMMLPVFGIPVLAVVLVAAAAASRQFSTAARGASVAVALLLACGAFTLIRTDGITGGGTAQLHWRWTPTAEERLLARAADEPKAPPPAPVGQTAQAENKGATPPPAAVATPGASPTEKPAAIPTAVAAAPASVPPAERGVALASASVTTESVTWPGFRGPERDGAVRGARIESDWSRSAPVELWRRPIGPGWSSFAVAGDLLYTQEQRGQEEVVACHRVSTGELVWRHRDAARFWESNAGAGPRGTPTLGNGRVYTLGATGILNVLDARTGSVVWSRNAASDTGVKTPGWGFSSSPLVLGDMVVVATSGVLAAYDVAKGERRWMSRVAGGGSYSSPHLATIEGVPQILFMAGGGLRSVAPADGALLWMHEWPGAPIVQPAVLADGDILISTAGPTGALGTRRLSVARGSGGWTVEERWTSNALKPYFNDFVVHEGHAYGFDGFILASVDIADGTRKWKGGRYGNGQLVLLPDQDLLLVLSEEGELALVSATPDKFTEIGRFPGIEGKTWNHPVLAGDVLLVRNGEEMAAFRLPLASR